MLNTQTTVKSEQIPKMDKNLEFKCQVAIKLSGNLLKICELIEKNSSLSTILFEFSIQEDAKMIYEALEEIKEGMKMEKKLPPVKGFYKKYLEYQEIGQKHEATYPLGLLIEKINMCIAGVEKYLDTSLLDFVAQASKFFTNIATLVGSLGGIGCTVVLAQGSNLLNKLLKDIKEETLLRDYERNKFLKDIDQNLLTIAENIESFNKENTVSAITTINASANTSFFSQGGGSNKGKKEVSFEEAEINDVDLCKIRTALKGIKLALQEISALKKIKEVAVDDIQKILSIPVAEKDSIIADSAVFKKILYLALTVFMDKSNAENEVKSEVNDKIVALLDDLIPQANVGPEEQSVHYQDYFRPLNT